MLWALVSRPRLIIPRELWKRLSSSQQSLLLAHELAHLRRGDHTIRLFELLVTAIFWWLPVVWWARQALRDAEEECCDAWVVWAFPEDARPYADTLLDTIDFLNPSRPSEPLLASGFGRAQHLRRRLTMIMLGTTPRRLGWASAMGTFAVSAVLLPLTPSWAQKTQETTVATTFDFELKNDEQTKPNRFDTDTFSFEFNNDEQDKPDPVESNISVVVAADGQVEQVQAASMEKAIELLKRRIEALANQSGEKEKAAAQRALKEAVAELEKSRARAAGSGGPKQPEKKEERRVYIRRLEEVSKLSAEQKAQVDKARSRVEQLRKELEDKRQQLANAQRELQKVVASGLKLEIRPPQLKTNRPLEFNYHAPTQTDAVIVDRQVSARKLADRDRTETTMNRSDKDRLDRLENQLAKLLAEVATLKKHDDKSR
jgi:beta-lactamase regulating signal transducer with metallopeptidase domain